MNYALVFRLLGRLLMMEAALMAPSLGVALIHRGGDAPAFLLAMGITLLCGTLLGFLLHPKREELTARDGMAVAGLSWVLLSIFGALPFVFSGAIPHLYDAIFEAASGFTTTGASILQNIEALPRGVLFWRSFTHWIGGMGVLVFTVAVLPRLSGRSSILARAESPGPTFSKLLPKMGDTAKMLYALYFALSLTECVCLLLAGMSVYDALIHTFGTAGTGGFSNYNQSVGSFQSPAIEWIIGVFMLLFGVNFAIYFHAVRREGQPILHSEEMWAYFGLALLATIGVTVAILPMYPDFFTALRRGFFQTTSIMSTTGFSTADFNAWPLFARGVLLIVMCTGACAGSTAGGFKISRVLLLVKSAYRDLEHTLLPRKVSVVRFEGKAVPENTMAQLGVYLFIYLCLFLVGGILLCLEGGDLTTSFTAALTCLSNVGPGLGLVGPTGNFAFFSPWAKLMLALLMLAGRLEVYPVLILFSPTVWKKN